MTVSGRSQRVRKKRNVFEGGWSTNAGPGDA